MNKLEFTYHIPGTKTPVAIAISSSAMMISNQKMIPRSITLLFPYLLVPSNNLLDAVIQIINICRYPKESAIPTLLISDTINRTLVCINQYYGPIIKTMLGYNKLDISIPGILIARCDDKLQDGIKISLDKDYPGVTNFLWVDSSYTYEANKIIEIIKESDNSFKPETAKTLAEKFLL